MSEVPEVDVEQIMRRIREDLRRRNGPAELPPIERRASPFDDGQGAVDLAYLGSGYDVRDVPLASHRRIAGPVVVRLKKALRKLLSPFLDRQVAYNAANVRVTRHIKEWIEELDGQYAWISRQIEALDRGRAELQELASRIQLEVGQIEARCLEKARLELRQEVVAVQALHAQALQAQAVQMQALQAQALEELRGQLRVELDRIRHQATTTREQVSGAERKLRRILHVMGESRPQDPPVNGELARELPASLEPDFDYAGFQERFRGSEEEIKERQRMYLPYFEGRESVIDLGCGRGEFVELLRERGIAVKGLDLDLDMVLLCRDKGLDVAMEDAFTYLGTRPDGSVGGIFAAQVIEHLSARQIIELVRLCHRKLAPGGTLVMETPNPTCLTVFANSFYRDLTHDRPIHPDTMQFLFEAVGLHGVELKFSAPVDPAMRLPSLPASGADAGPFNRALERLNALLYGFQDYAVIGRKGR